MAMAEDMSVSELKQALIKMRVRCDHCFEKSELLALYKEEVGRERPLPNAGAAATGFASATGAAPAPAPAPPPARPAPTAAAAGGGSYVNGRYVPPPKSGLEAMLGDFDFKTIAMVVIAMWWVWGVANQGGGGMDGVGDDEGEYDERDTSSYINGKVVEVMTHDQFLGALTHHRDNTGLPVVVDFFSHSCGPCRMIAPEYKKLARQFKGKAVFLKVDVNANYETSQAARVRAMPTFQFFQNGKKKHEFSGADSRQLHQIISQMSSKAERHGTYVGVEVTAAALETFYTKHDPEKAGDAAKTAKKFTRKTNKLMTALKDKYEDVPELQPEGTEAEQKKAKRAETKKSGAAGGGGSAASGGGGGKSLSDYDLDALQAEVTRRIGADATGEEEDDDDGTELFLSEEAGTKIGPSSGVEEVTIIGGGPAGLAAAIYAARAGLKPLIVAPAFGGQLLGKGVDVENYPGVVGSEATGRGIVDLMRKQAVAFDTRMLNDAVVNVASPVSEGEPFTVTLNGTQMDGSENTERPLLSRTVIVATGADSRWLGVKGEHDFRGKGVSSCATCDGFLFRDQPVVVVGGGDTAMEDALVLARTSSSVTIVHRRESFRASKVLADRVLSHPKISVVWNSVVEEFVGSSEQLTHVVVKSTADGSTSDIPCVAGFVAIGHIPNTDFVSQLVERDPQGYVKLAEAHSTKTAVAGLFACGDAADKVYRQAITSAGSGAMAALDAERWLSEHKSK
jgi:thioredoxin reductase (NADPH)